MLRATLQVIGASSDISLAFIVMVQVVLGAVVGILASWKGLIWYVLAFVLTGFGILIMLLNVMAIQW